MQRPLLSIWGDEGPRDTPAFWFLSARSFRALFFFDPLHRITRDLALAAKSADMWAMLLDTTICLNWDQNPFHSQGWWQVAMEGAADFCAVADPNDDLFVQCYENICADRNDRSSVVGSEEHYRSVFSSLQFDSAFEKVHSVVQWTRWGSWHHRMRSFLTQWHERLLVLSTVALRLEFYYKSANDLPLWGNTILPAAPAAASRGAAAGPSVQPSNVASSAAAAPASSSAPLRGLLHRGPLARAPRSVTCAQSARTACTW